MIVELSTDQPPRLTEADRLDQLHVVCSGDSNAMRYDDFCQPGADAEHVWIDIARLRSEASTQVDDPSYADRFEGMIAYATSKGWLDATGTRVRAHIER